MQCVAPVSKKKYLIWVRKKKLVQDAYFQATDTAMHVESN
jgi:hypothetical protein